jgi:hypothetical protein
LLGGIATLSLTYYSARSLYTKVGFVATEIDRPTEVYSSANVDGSGERKLTAATARISRTPRVAAGAWTTTRT